MTSPVTSPEPAASRRELKALLARVTAMDEHGTRRLIGIAVQLSEMAKDLGRLETRANDHELAHQGEARARTAARRWALGFAVSVLVALVAVFGLLVQLSMRIR